MNAPALTGLCTPDELPVLPDEEGYEVVDGQLVEKHVGFWSGYVGLRLARILGNYCEERALGWVNGPETGYQCFPGSPKLVRKPDVSFVRLGRFPNEQPPQGHTKIAPDLAVEVVSPQDLFYDISERVDDYRGAGVPLIWVVDPRSRCVVIHRLRGPIGGVREQDDLDGEDVVPGFRCAVRELFRSPADGVQGPPA